MIKSNPKQTFIGVWYHDTNLEDDLKSQMEFYLEATFYHYRIFAHKEDFYAYIDEEQLAAKIFLIISISEMSSLKGLIELTQQYPNIFEKVYIYLSTKDFECIYDVKNNITDLSKRIAEDIADYNAKSICLKSKNDKINIEPKPLNISRINGVTASLSTSQSKSEQNTSIRHVSTESLIFLSFRTMTDILLKIPTDTKEIKNMWVICRGLYRGDKSVGKKIDDLAVRYTEDDAIKYYTESSFLFHVVNQACRTENIQHMYNFRVYINHLHTQLKKLNEKQKVHNNTPLDKIYRGKPLSGSIVQKLIDNKNGLIMMNGFLSTTLDINVSYTYGGYKEKIDEGYKSVLFHLKINKTEHTYANISKYSQMQDEKEILFSHGTIWQIESYVRDNDSYTINLISSDKLDSQIVQLFQKYTEEGCNLSAIGDILHDLDDINKAEWFYRRMLEDNSLDKKTKGNLYNKIGMMRFEKEDYSTALENLRTAASFLKLSPNMLRKLKLPRSLVDDDTQLTLLVIYNNLGVLWEKEYKYEEAIDCYEQALKVNGPKLKEAKRATVHDNLGLLYHRLGEHEKAQKHHKNAIELAAEDSLQRKKYEENLKYVEVVLSQQRLNQELNNEKAKKNYSRLKTIKSRLFYNIFIIAFLIGFTSIIFLKL